MKVQVDAWPSHPETVGKQALIESQYVLFCSCRGFLTANDRLISIDHSAMKKCKRRRLEVAEWKIGGVKEFLGLSDEEAALVEEKLGLVDVATGRADDDAKNSDRSFRARVGRTLT